jgi:hypothetical protein
LDSGPDRVRQWPLGSGSDRVRQQPLNCISIIHGMVEALSGRRSVEELLAIVDPNRRAVGFAGY